MVNKISEYEIYSDEEPSYSEIRNCEITNMKYDPYKFILNTNRPDGSSVKMSKLYDNIDATGRYIVLQTDNVGINMPIDGCSIEDSVVIEYPSTILVTGANSNVAFILLKEKDAIIDFLTNTGVITDKETKQVVNFSFEAPSTKSIKLKSFNDNIQFIYDKYGIVDDVRDSGGKLYYSKHIENTVGTGFEINTSSYVPIVITSDGIQLSTTGHRFIKIEKAIVYMDEVVYYTKTINEYDEIEFEEIIKYYNIQTEEK